MMDCSGRGFESPRLHKRKKLMMGDNFKILDQDSVYPYFGEFDKEQK